MLLWRRHGPGGLPRHPGGGRAGAAVPQLQRRSVRQPDGSHQPADGPVPPDPVLRQAPVRPGGVRLFRRGPAGPSADLGAEYEQVLFPAAPLLPAGNRQRAGQSDPPARHPEHRRRLCERDDDAIKQALRIRRRACAFYSMSTVMLSVPCCSNSPRYSSMRLMTSS